MSKLAELQARREERLWNWARWWNGFDSSGVSRSTCASAERHYVAPRIDDDPNEVPSYQGKTIDVRDAEWIEAGVKRLPLAEVKMLRGIYVAKLNPWRMAKNLKISLNELQQWRSISVDRACVEADRLRDNNGQVMLIRRGSMLWAGVASAESTVYKSAHIVASAEQTARQVQPVGWACASEGKLKSPA